MKLHRFFIIFLSLLLITCDMRADGGDVLERIIRLPGTKGTVYSLLSKVSEQSGYLFVYDSKVVNNDIEVRTKKKNCTLSIKKCMRPDIRTESDRKSYLDSASCGEDRTEAESLGRDTFASLFHHYRSFAG